MQIMKKMLTLIFAILQRKNVKLNSINDSIDDLPKIPKKDEAISTREAILGIIFIILATSIFIFIPQIIAVYFSNHGFVPIFNVKSLESIWYIIVMLAILGIVREVFKLYDGIQTIRFVIIVAIVNISSIILLFILFKSNVMNPSLLQYFNSYDQVKLIDIMKNLIPGLISFGLILGIFNTFKFAIKYSK